MTEFGMVTQMGSSVFLGVCESGWSQRVGASASAKVFGTHNYAQKVQPRTTKFVKIAHVREQRVSRWLDMPPPHQERGPTVCQSVLWPPGLHACTQYQKQQAKFLLLYSNVHRIVLQVTYELQALLLHRGASSSSGHWDDRLSWRIVDAVQWRSRLRHNSRGSVVGFRRCLHVHLHRFHGIHLYDNWRMLHVIFYVMYGYCKHVHSDMFCVELTVMQNTLFKMSAARSRLLLRHFCQ